MESARAAEKQQEPEKTASKLSEKLAAETTPKSVQELAKGWDKAFDTKDFTTINADLKVAAAEAYRSAGKAGLIALQTNVTNATHEPAAGIAIFMKGDKIEIHHFKQVLEDEVKKLPKAEQDKLLSLADTVDGNWGHGKELSPPITIDKPKVQAQGIKLKPGEKISSEFPSEYAIAKAFKAGELLNADWITANPEQRYLVDNLQTAASELEAGKIPDGMLDGLASNSAEKINAFLQQHGLSMRIGRLGPHDLGVAASLTLQASWAGEATKMTIDDKEYPAALVSGITSFTQGKVEVAQLYNKDGLTVYAALIGKDKLASYEVTQRAANLTPTGETPIGKYESVLMPKVSKHVVTDLEGLIGMMSTNGFTIGQAKMETGLDIDEHGFKATQGFAASVSRGAPPPPMRLDQPFIIWATYKGCSQPLFATAVGQQHWKDPKAAAKK